MTEGNFTLPHTQYLCGNTIIPPATFQHIANELGTNALDLIAMNEDVITLIEKIDVMRFNIKQAKKFGLQLINMINAHSASC